MRDRNRLLAQALHVERDLLLALRDQHLGVEGAGADHRPQAALQQGGVDLRRPRTERVALVVEHPHQPDLILRAPKDFALYSGDDASALAFILMGRHGTISVTANVAPGLMHQMCVAALEGKAIQARQINARLFGLHRHLFIEANPIPVKWAVSRMSLMEGGIRLPLTPLSEPHQDRVLQAMREAGVAV